MYSNRSRILWEACSHVPGRLWTRTCCPNTIRSDTSGIEVKPKVYLALGISGAFQHVGGIKGSPLIVAVNKDARAPIFRVAQYGIVADLNQVVPALEEKIKELKG